MGFMTLGVSHKTAPVHLRERLSLHLADSPMLFDRARQLLGSSDVVVLSTCNRTEVYALCDTDTQLFRHLLSELTGVPHAELAPHLYCYMGKDAVRHGLRVASGLESMLLGETQIMGQFKTAAASTASFEPLSREFSALIEAIFRGARQIRASCRLGEHALSLGMAAEKLVAQIFAEPEHLHVLAVGAGQTNRQVLRHLCKRPFASLTIANRSAERARELSAELAAALPSSSMVQTHALEQLPELLSGADVLVTCTASMHALVSYEGLSRAMKLRRYKPMLVVDLAVPRDVESRCAQIDEVYLYGIDDLEDVIAENRKLRLASAERASVEVELQCERIETQRRIAAQGQRIGRLTQVLESSIDDVKAEGLESEEALRRLGGRLMHGPYRLMRELAQIENDELRDKLINSLLGAYESPSHDNQ